MLKFMPHRLFLHLCTIGLLTACVTPPTGSLSSAPAGVRQAATFVLAARFSLSYLPPEAPFDTPPEQYSGRLEWLHDTDTDEVLFLDPLGQGIARLRREASGLTVLKTRDGAQQTAASADQLLEAALGVPLPFEDLLNWIEARPGAGALVERDAQNRPWRARTSGWLLTYAYSDAQQHLPARLEASLDNRLKLRLVIESREIQP
ncbi:MAG: outer membrane lipoprotein LolB [Zoogloeaceae bacterium]|nr:outer membrane lipoprotein LolB [Zoogloeaceae bacterium]